MMRSEDELAVGAHAWPCAWPTTRLRVLLRHLRSSSASLELDGPEPAPVLGPRLASSLGSSPGLSNRAVMLKNLPKGEPKPSDFEIVTAPLRALGAGEMLLKTKWLSLDPYMRTGEGMNNPKAVGKTLIGGTVSEVVESQADGWHVGDLVVGYYGWQEYAIAKPTDVQWGLQPWKIEKWDPSLGDASSALGMLGMTGYTAYFGLFEKGKPNAGDTIVVSAASGAVGAIVGQLAKVQGCKVVGVAGGPNKCAYCVKELGFDACVDYKASGFPQALAAAVPKGVDIYFENVGGDVLEAVIPLLNKGCRVPVCGFVSQYNSADTRTSAAHPKTPLQRLKEIGIPVMGKKGATDGFAFFGFMEYLQQFPEALRELSQLKKEGKLKERQSVSHGIEKSVDAFIGMLRGENFGKTLVQIS